MDRYPLVTLTAVILVSMVLGGAGQVAGQAPSMDLAFREAREHSPLPLTLAYEQAQWAVDQQRVSATAELDAQDNIDSRIEDLQRQTARDRKLAKTIFDDGASLGARCVTEALQGCSSSMGGYLNLRGRRPLQWQLQDGFTDEDGISGGIVFIGDAEAARYGPTAPVAWAFDAAYYQAPVLLSGPEFDGHAYVVVPGTHAGSGAGNADLMFRWNAQGSPQLSQIDTWSWRDGVGDRLPAGLEIGSSLRIDWMAMTAFTPLRQPGDGGCCATGGAAILSLSVQGDRLVLDDLRVTAGHLDSTAARR